MSKKIRKTSAPTFKAARLKKLLIRDRYIQIFDINALFTLNKKQENILLTEVIQSFWRGELNLFFFPNLSEFCSSIPNVLDENSYNKYIDETRIHQIGNSNIHEFPTYSEFRREFHGNMHHLPNLPEFVIREFFRQQLISSEIGKRLNLKKFKFLNKNAEIQDGPEQLYSPLKEEKWAIYRQHFNSLKQKHCEFVCGNAVERKQQHTIPASLDPLYKKFGKPLCKCKHSFSSEDIADKMGWKDYNALIFYNSLCVEYKNLVRISSDNPSDIFPCTMLPYVKNSITETLLHSKNHEPLVKDGYILSDEYFFSRFLDIKRNNPSIKVLDACQQIHDNHKGIPKIETINRIVHNQKLKEIKDSFPLCPKEETARQDYISSLAEKLCTTPTFIKKVFSQSNSISIESPKSIIADYSVAVADQPTNQDGNTDLAYTIKNNGYIISNDWLLRRYNACKQPNPYESNISLSHNEIIDKMYEELAGRLSRQAIEQKIHKEKLRTTKNI